MGHLPRLIASFLALGVLKQVMPLERLAKRAWQPPRPNSSHRPRAEIVGRVLQAGRWCGLPDRDCVQRSLLLFRELSRHGFRPVLIMGLRKEGERVTGHAWVEVDGAPVAEPAEAVAVFTTIARFGDGGALLSVDGAGAVKASA